MAVELALIGDPTALRLCLERILPPCRDRMVKFALPPIESAADIAAAIKAVTSALAAGESIGVPVTLRGVASSVAITTAQGPASMSRLRDLAAASDTLVVMMARTNLTEVAAAIASVVGRDRPAALVSKATWPDQRSVEGPVSDIARIADRAGIDAPATLIVGDVVSALTVSGLQLATG